jgi:hypothetical protein
VACITVARAGERSAADREGRDVRRRTGALCAAGVLVLAGVIGGGEAAPTAAPVDLQATVNTAVRATVQAAPAPTRAPAATPAPAPLDEATIRHALAAGGFPTDDVRAFTPDTDPNQLLGRPGQYVAKVSWTDPRAPEGDATIEVFADAEALRARKAYTEAISPAGGPFTQYLYANEPRRALLRLPHQLTPDQAKTYQDWLASL